jgi:hypothetical protein
MMHPFIILQKIPTHIKLEVSAICIIFLILTLALFYASITNDSNMILVYGVPYVIIWVILYATIFDLLSYT